MPAVDAGRSEISQAEEAYRRLLRLLRAARGMFALIPVESELEGTGRKAEEDAWLERLRHDLAREGLVLVTVELSFELWDPLDGIERAWVQAHGNKVVLLRGLEKTPAEIPESEGPRPPAFARLNIDRESLEHRFPAPLIVWCTPASFEALRTHAPDFFDHFTGLIHFTSRLYRHMAVPSPSSFVPRREFEQVVEILLELQGRTILTLFGAGGFGKTTLAQAVCFDDQIRSAFPDGILWATMGAGLTNSDRLERMRDLSRFWEGVEPPVFATLHEGREHLRDMLSGQRVLLVVDDVWSSADLEPFRGLGSGVVLLVTTRNSWAVPNESARVDVGTMRHREAVALLGDGFTDAGEGALAALAARLGGWPLLLRLVNRQLLELLREGLGFADALVEIEKELDGIGLTAFDIEDGQAQSRSVVMTLELSLRLLPTSDRERFEDLAVFPGDIDVPLGILERLWALERQSARTLCFRFRDLSLLDFDGEKLRLHDVIHQYLVHLRVEALPELNWRLLDRCRPPSGRWIDLSETEDYLWRYLASHLIEAGGRAELRNLLFDFDYLEAKLRTVGVNALLADYDALGDRGEARMLQEALRLSAHVLSRNWDRLLGQQLAGQLSGRWVQVGEVGRRLLQRAAGRTPLRPRHVRLSRTGGSLIRTLEGHTAEVVAVAVLEDKCVVSASHDRTLRIWDVQSGVTIRTLEGHTAGVLAVVVLKDKRVVSASSDRTLRVWDVESGETLRTLEGHTAGVEAVAVLDEKRLVSASRDRTLRVWDVESGETLRTLRGHTGAVQAVAVLEEKRVISASWDQTLRIWDVESGETLRALKGHTSGVRVVAKLDERHVVSASSDQTLRVGDIESGETLRTLKGHTSGVGAVVMLDGRRVVSASDDQTLRVWDIESGKTLRTLEGHTAGVEAVAVLDGRRVVSASDDHTLRVWDVESGETLRTPEGHTYGVEAVAVLDDRHVASASYDRTLRIWDASSGETLHTLEGHTAGVLAVAVLDNRRVVSASLDETLRIWDVESGKMLRTLEGHSSGVLAVAVLNDKRMVSASDDRTLRIWDAGSGETLHTLEGHTSFVRAVGVLDEKRVISASDDRTLRVWDIDSGEATRKFEDHTAGILAVAVLDDRHVVSASLDEILRIWDVESGKTVHTLEGHTSFVRAVAVLDEKRVVSASSDQTLRVWNVESGDTIAVFALEAPAVAVATDGRMVIAGDEVGGVHFLDLDLHPRSRRSPS